ncbi:hypothetical protein [Paenibacillus cymbidii]|uniref:hypothetical protein n=1 Tax=Paenibacillus cymbidii TaxID=1639034 RepID=UPI0010817C3A|nr:hypothetical protein [Paenibacillus cymbidii]
MFETMLFIHLTGLAVWFGSMAAIGLMLLAFRRDLRSEEAKKMVGKMVKLFNRLTHPSSFLVLVSGGLMMMDRWSDTDHPFWLTFMERVGGAVVLLSIIALTIAGRKLTKRLGGGASGAGQAASAGKAPAAVGAGAAAMAGVRLNGYLSTMGVAAVGVLAVIFVVSFRF